MMFLLSSTSQPKSMKMASCELPFLGFNLTEYICWSNGDFVKAHTFLSLQFFLIFLFFYTLYFIPPLFHHPTVPHPILPPHAPLPTWMFPSPAPPTCKLHGVSSLLRFRFIISECSQNQQPCTVCVLGPTYQLVYARAYSFHVEKDKSHMEDTYTPLLVDLALSNICLLTIKWIFHIGSV